MPTRRTTWHSRSTPKVASHGRLKVRIAERLATHPGPVILSNQATSRIRTLYRQLGFTLEFLKPPRLTSCTGHRVPATEVLAVKNL